MVKLPKVGSNVIVPAPVGAGPNKFSLPENKMQTSHALPLSKNLTQFEI
jgi:hypothetical protein